MSSIQKYLKKLREKTESSSISQSRYGQPSVWISTGSGALNRIISGSIKKGIPSGRIIVFCGQSASGKTLIAGRVMANALKMGFEHIFYFDSEGGATATGFKNMGCDPDKIEHITVSSVEKAQIKVLETYNMIKEIKKEHPEMNFLCVFDSLGALNTEKVITDADKGKVAGDMGLKAKSIRSFMSALTIPALQTDTAMLAITHTYANPNQLYASKIQEMSGGNSVKYLGSIIVQTDKVFEKDEDKDESGQFYSGANLKFFTVKNRFARPGLETVEYLDFKFGFCKPIAALFDQMVRGKFILNPKQGYYTLPFTDNPDKLYRRAQIETNPALVKPWLNQFDEWSIKDLQYSNIGNAELDEEAFDKELDEMLSKDEETPESGSSPEELPEL